MTTMLASFVEGRWVEGRAPRTPLHDPTTEEVLAEAGTEGVDFAAALAYARDTGGPALRQLTFARRGALLGALAKCFHEHREELLELSTANGGNTRPDAKFDLDGATGTLAFYAALGEQLGAHRWLDDGALIALGAKPQFVGTHVRMPRPGAAVHVNAFNFPAWGAFEKAAVALLAGVPVICKPATATALLTWRMTQLIADAELLPPGAFSLLAGGIGDLLDHLDYRDVLAFTGSADTGNRLRARPDLIERSVRVNLEADSLNAAVLAPDLDRDFPGYDLFLRELRREQTQKAGQKCTATRRVFVPAARLEAVADDLIAQLRAVRVGNPARGEVHMGPLATAGQLADARAGLAALRREAEPVFGDGGRGPLVDVPDDTGYFMAPVLLVAQDAARAQAVHEREVFGPVLTLLPYSGDAEEAAALVARGRGGLVASCYSDDRGFAERFCWHAAPHVGRIHLGGSKVAESSHGPGAVLPALMHGGPGRSGGGEELGGARALHFYTQQTAVQGYEPIVRRLTTLAGETDR